jgi:hypothetical protein
MTGEEEQRIKKIIEHFEYSINKIKDLKDGWDGENSKAFKKNTIEKLYDIKNKITNKNNDIIQYITNIYAFPCNDNEITIEFEFIKGYGMDLIIECDIDKFGYIFYYTYKDNINFITEKDCIEDEYMIYVHIRYLIHKYILKTFKE